MFVALWEFKVKPGFEIEFERVYGSDGDWAQLFRKEAAYRGTRFAKDLDRDGWYFTIDTWESRAAYEAFRNANREAYAELDRRCERLTGEENKIGTIES
ncbi:MAG TPA: antibiotic biosynthesis monooxygenase [Candidatus Acidoferrales bacterium]|nr:antibiotic biosynthesis monooxygenase [Candidatus Acidoferrales bacterium]